MRPELHDIERIDQYIDGSMPAAEKILFEKEMAMSPGLQEAVETQSLLVTAVSRKALLAQVQFHAPPRTPASSGSVGLLSKFKWPIILSSIVAASIFTWFSTRHKERKAKKETTEMVADVNNANHSNGDSASNTETADEINDTTFAEGNNIAHGIDFTYQPARRTVVNRSSQKSIGGLDTWVSPEVQRVLINPNKEELVECRDGSVVFIPKNTFVDSKGELVKETVTLEIVEALTFDKMVMYNLATMNGKNALVSEGMIYIQPKRGAEELQFAPGKSIQIDIPTAKYNSEMLAWKGVPTGDGNINWEEPKAIENFLTTVPMASLDFLPEGFRAEVQSTMPYKNHKRSSKELEDSLYYALTSLNTSNANNQWNSIVIDEQGQIVKSIVTTPQESTVGIKPTIPKTKGQYNLSVNFDNLPKDKKFKVQVNQGKFEATSDIENNHATINYTNLATANIRVYSSQCEIVFDNVNLARDAALTLDCKNIDCKLATLNSNASAKATEVKWEKCYLNPSSVGAIYDEKFANTFIATPEFQERLQVLHRMPSAQTYLNMYLQNLDKNLHEIDAQIAQKTRGTDKQRFLDFANQKHTNVRNTGQDFALLRNYYVEQQNKMHQAAQQRQELYAKKNAAELAEIQNQFNKMQLDFAKKKAEVNETFNQMVNTPKGKNPRSIGSLDMAISPIVTGLLPNNPRPTVGQQQSYSVSWNASGWMNIDAYLHELSKGEIVIPILASSEKTRGRIYQSINSLKTLVPLNYLKTGYEAHFPKNPSTNIYDKSMCLSIDRISDNRYHLASTVFNPYTSQSVTLGEGRDYSERELKAVLEVLHPGSDQISAQLEKENVAIQAELERRQRAEELAKRRKEQMDALDKERIEVQKDLDAQKTAILDRHKMEAEYMQHLENVINPCHVDYKQIVVRPPTNSTVPDDGSAFGLGGGF